MALLIYFTVLPRFITRSLIKLRQEPNRSCCCFYHPEPSVPFACLFHGCTGSTGFEWCWKMCRWRHKQATRSRDGGSAGVVHVGCSAGCLWHDLVLFNVTEGSTRAFGELPPALSQLVRVQEVLVVGVSQTASLASPHGRWQSSSWVSQGWEGYLREKHNGCVVFLLIRPWWFQWELSKPECSWLFQKLYFPLQILSGSTVIFLHAIFKKCSWAKSSYFLKTQSFFINY